MSLIEKYLRYLRYERNYSSLTEISYSKDLSQFADFVQREHSGLNMVSVDPDVVRLWIVSLMESGFSARSVNRKLSALKSFYKYLMRIGEVVSSPVKNILGPKMKKPIPSFVNYSEMLNVLDEDNFDDTFEAIRDRLILELFYVTGMRRAELIGVRDVDVDFAAGTILVTGKRNKQRLIPISDDLKEQLEDYMYKRDEEIENQTGFLFVKSDGKQLYPMLVYRVVNESLRGISTLSKASPHILRHSFATGMLNNGADINAVKELLGHSSLASTEVYTHTSFEELKNIYNKAHPRA